jgi:hypothetical protein
VPDSGGVTVALLAAAAIPTLLRAFLIGTAIVSLLLLAVTGGTGSVIALVGVLVARVETVAAAAVDGADGSGGAAGAAAVLLLLMTDEVELYLRSKMDEDTITGG